MSTHLRLHTTLMMAVGCGDMISDQVGERWGFHVCSIRLRPVRLCLFELRLALSTYYELRLSLARPDASSLCTLSVFPSCSAVAFLTSAPSRHLSRLCEEPRTQHTGARDWFNSKRTKLYGHIGKTIPINIFKIKSDRRYVHVISFASIIT